MAEVEAASGGGIVPLGIAQEILANGGCVTFARFMELALTHPTDGYYCRARRPIGWRGDFSTAPLLCPEFNQALGRLVEEILDGVSAAQGRESEVAVIELGPGGAEVASTVLAGWGIRRPDLRERVKWVLVEVGEALRDKQRRVLSRAVRDGWTVEWAGDLKAALGEESGVASDQVRLILSNEFVDALPVHVVRVDGDRALEAYVEITPVHTERVGPAKWAALGSWEAREVWRELSPLAQGELEFLFGSAESSLLGAWTQDGVLELRPGAREVFVQAAGGGAVCVLTVDYGEAFGSGPMALRECEGRGTTTCTAPVPPLYRRTLRGYFRHQQTQELYARIGRQDLTADVDFRALHLYGEEAGFETVVFATVADLLRAHGAEGRLRILAQRAGRPTAGALQAQRETSILSALLQREGLGGAFKVLLQVRDRMS